MSYLRYLSIGILMLSLTACTSGRIDNPKGMAIVATNSFLGENVTLVPNSVEFCQYTLVKEQEGKYRVASVGSDYVIFSQLTGSKILVPISNLCFQI